MRAIINAIASRLISKLQHIYVFFCGLLVQGKFCTRIKIAIVYCIWGFLVSCTIAPVKQEQPKHDLRTVTLDHKYFQILYSQTHRLPVWVEYTVTKADLKGSGKRRDNFHKDKLLENMGITPVGPNDYPGDKFDRGHMAPAADFKRSQEATDETFVMSNMAPQTANLNRRAWEKLEARVRTWICGEEKLTVISGPILKTDLPRLEKGITIPERFFKVVYDETPPLKSIAFIYSQSDSGDPYLNRIVDFKDVEKETGLRFSKETTKYPEVKDIGAWKACK